MQLEPWSSKAAEECYTATTTSWFLARTAPLYIGDAESPALKPPPYIHNITANQIILKLKQDDDLNTHLSSLRQPEALSTHLRIDSPHSGYC
jgi:hypothetical protein